MSLVFNEESLLDGNIFKYEQRLKSATTRFVEGGAILTTYYSLKEDASTVDRGLQDVDKLFGKSSPLRFNKIKNFPIYGFGQANPSNSDEVGIEDITVEGECIILPSTLVPNPNDFFILNHLKMKALFQVIDVQYDSMKTEGYYKIRYRLCSTSDERLNNLEKQSVGEYHTELDAIGTKLNPIIQKDDFVRRNQIKQMMNQMIRSYRSLFYNERHNCFLFPHPQSGYRWFDLCGNHFMSKNSLMNPPNSNKVIILHEKINDNQFDLHYNNSIYSWIELGSPKRLLQHFYFSLFEVEGYTDSTFYRWYDHDVRMLIPIPPKELGVNNQDYSFFDSKQLDMLMMEKINSQEIVGMNEYEKLIWRYINQGHSLSIQDVSLYTADALLSSIKHADVFLYTPIVLFIIGKILRMN